MLSCVKSSTPRTRRSLSGPAVVGAVQIGIPASHKVLDDWCKNVTKHLNTTQEKFVSYEDCVRFNANLIKFYNMQLSQFVAAYQKGRKSD